jgi:hypothetical protein
VQSQNHWARWFRTEEDIYWNLGLLWKYDYIKDGKIFYCPSKLSPFQYKDYSDPVFPSPVMGGTSGVRIPYTYNPICKSIDDRERAVKNMAEPRSGKSLVLVNVLRAEGVAHINGWNAAPGDLSVRFVVESTILEDMENSDGFIDADYEARDRVMDKLRM